MNQTNKYAIRVPWIFAILVISILATIYAAQVKFVLLFFICIIVIIILSLGMLYLVLQANKALEKSDEEILRLRQREKARLQRWQQVTEDSYQQQEAFKGDEMLAKIIPAAGTDFEDLTAYTENVLQNIANEMDIVQGLVFVLSDANQLFHISGQYAYYSEEQPQSFALGETLSGQVAKNRKLLNIKELTEGYVTILSGLGKSATCHLIIAPIVCNYKSIGIMELASFKPFGEKEESLIQNVCDAMAQLLNELRS